MSNKLMTTVFYTHIGILHKGINKKFSRGASRGEPLPRTSFIGIKPIHIKESSDSREGGKAPLLPLMTPMILHDILCLFRSKTLKTICWLSVKQLIVF